jgi:hypothetical protein
MTFTMNERHPQSPESEMRAQIPGRQTIAELKTSTPLKEGNQIMKKVKTATGTQAQGRRGDLLQGPEHFSSWIAVHGEEKALSHAQAGSPNK